MSRTRNKLNSISFTSSQEMTLFVIWCDIQALTSHGRKKVFCFTVLKRGTRLVSFSFYSSWTLFFLVDRQFDIWEVPHYGSGGFFSINSGGPSDRSPYDTLLSFRNVLKVDSQSYIKISSSYHLIIAYHIIAHKIIFLCEYSETNILESFWSLEQCS